MNKEDPRVIRTKKMFKEALEELLLKKDEIISHLNVREYLNLPIIFLLFIKWF